MVYPKNERRRNVNFPVAMCDLSHYHSCMDASLLISAIERKALEMNLSPSTIGERAGQGGRFYARLVEGRRVWPETAERVLARLARMAPQSEGE